MIINRVWAMPNKNTFSIKPIGKLLRKYIYGFSVDPFANSNRYATKTNDLDPQFDTDTNMDAVDFLKTLKKDSVDSVLFDPPYSSTQISKSYRRLGLNVNFETTQGSYWRKLKKEIKRIVVCGGICISCGWNSGGIGKQYGFEIIEILLVSHGGAHHDTIVTVEIKKVSAKQTTMELK